MSTLNTTNVSGGMTNTPLILFQPFNIIVFLSFFSPIIIAVSMVSLSFIFQNFKGFIYLGYLIGLSFVRNYVYMLNGAQTIINDKSICNSVQYSKYGNSSFSSFVFAFTIMYLCLPMFSQGAVNFWIFIGLLVYFFVDIFIKVYKGCLVKMGDLFLNVLMGVASAALIVSLMYAGGSGEYLFFNEVSSGKDVCSVPSKQTFKCAVYKNGELLGNI
jgi:hypothetical protein